ncbi:hypothetical protein [Mycobacterium parmense]|uniref:Uncharacterized protein n=1 Tax=Mycobacterium parmense TaxID=185642 RepID=A0A7I7YMP1_9MYCO|nr:hypothetical protein [Mycobacterium parmense]MCV7348996.1 hypothetical protein [Mycobacterium parmense]BBZ43126.1 hypothetical protein MPRM_04070 [Mycobacterium parmense]
MAALALAAVVMAVATLKLARLDAVSTREMVDAEVARPARPDDAAVLESPQEGS